jgi:hypothetical protein
MAWHGMAWQLVDIHEHIGTSGRIYERVGGVQWGKKPPPELYPPSHTYVYTCMLLDAHQYIVGQHKRG